MSTKKIGNPDEAIRLVIRGESAESVIRRVEIDGRLFKRRDWLQAISTTISICELSVIPREKELAALCELVMAECDAIDARQEYESQAVTVWL